MVGKEKEVRLEMSLSDFYDLLDKFLSRLFLTEKVLFLTRGFKEINKHDVLELYSNLLYDFLTKDLKIQIKTEKEG